MTHYLTIQKSSTIKLLLYEIKIAENRSVGDEAEAERLEDLLKQVQRTSESVNSAIEKTAPSLGFEF